MAPQLTKSSAPKMYTITINGLLPSIEFQRAKCCAEDLYKKKPNVFYKPVINGMLEFDWSMWFHNKKKELRGESWGFKDHVMVFIDNQLLGDTNGFIHWSMDNYNYEDFRNEVLYETLRKEAYSNYIANTKNDFVYLSFVQGDEEIGTVLIELFKNITPKTCENFRLLCTGERGRSEATSTKLHFKDTIVHRIIPDGWIQAGDIISGKGNTGESVYGGFFEDESFAVKHDKRGILGMANQGRHTNGSQFYICLQPVPFMDKQYVAFGQIVEGSKTIEKLEKIHTLNERPIKEVGIADCGEFKFEF